MHLASVLLLATLSSVAVAQLSDIPKCAQECFGNNLGGCGQFDIKCVCAGERINDVSCCVFRTCSQADRDATINFAVKLCKGAGVDVNTNPTCPSSSAPPASSAASNTVTDVAASTTGASNGTPTTSGAPTTSAPQSTGGPGPVSLPSSSPTGAAPLHTAGPGLGMGLAVAGLLVAL